MNRGQHSTIHGAQSDPSELNPEHGGRRPTPGGLRPGGQDGVQAVTLQRLFSVSAVGSGSLPTLIPAIHRRLPLTWLDRSAAPRYRIGMSSGYHDPDDYVPPHPRGFAIWIWMGGVLALLLVAVWILSGEIRPTVL